MPEECIGCLPKLNVLVTIFQRAAVAEMLQTYCSILHRVGLLYKFLSLN